jgi:hypothetical protein
MQRLRALASPLTILANQFIPRQHPSSLRLIALYQAAASLQNLPFKLVSCMWWDRLQAAPKKVNGSVQ